MRIDGLEVHVRVEGDGPPTLLLHGFRDRGELRRFRTPALIAAGFRLIVPDLRGCGDTDAPAEVARYRLDRLVADVLDRAGIERKVKGRDLVLVIAPGVAERLLRARDFRALPRHAPTPEDAARGRRDLTRPSRLTAGPD